MAARWDHRELHSCKRRSLPFLREWPDPIPQPHGATYGLESGGKLLGLVRMRTRKRKTLLESCIFPRTRSTTLQFLL